MRRERREGTKGKERGGLTRETDRRQTTSRKNLKASCRVVSRASDNTNLVRDKGNRVSICLHLWSVD